MSLIIDALKKAQQLRLNEADGHPIFKNPYPNKRRKGNFKRQWILIGAGLISLGILMFVFLKPPSLPSATRTNQAMVSVEIKPPPPVVKERSPESSNEMAGLPKSEEPLPTNQALNRPGSGQPLNQDDSEQVLSSAKGGISLEKTANHAVTKQVLNRAGSGQAPTRRSSKVVAALSDRPPRSDGEKKSLETKALPPLSPPATQKEEAPSKSIGVEQIGGKDSALASDVLYHFNSGVTFFNQKDFSKAIQAYHKVIELDPTYVEAYNNLGILYQMVGDIDRALGAYQKSIEINPKYEKGYNNLGVLLLLSGRYEEASEAFQKALAVNSNNIESHIHLGILLKKKGQCREAIESYQKALAIDPLHRETHYNIALLYEQLENVELAVVHYQQFIQLSSRSHPELVSRVQRHLKDLLKIKSK